MEKRPKTFDNELMVLRDAHNLSSKQCLIVSDYVGSKNYSKTCQVLDTLLCDDYLDRWHDNSLSKFPPDLINEKDCLMMEVMRVDDHSSDGKKNPVLAEERKIYKEIEPFLPAFPNLEMVHINAKTSLSTQVDHNYKNYYTSFQRTVRKHASKIAKYRENFPGKELIFFVMDETSGVYFEQILGNNGRLHCVWFDTKFASKFTNIDIEYFIFYTPYNYFKTVEFHSDLPKLVIFDIKNLKNGKMMRYYEYDESKMISNEE